MIVKSLTRKGNSGQLLKYVLRYISNDEKTKTALPFLLKHNIAGQNIDELIRAFKENEHHRTTKRVGQTIAYHDILTWSNADASKLTPTILKDIAKKYVALRGLSNIYVMAVHYDKEHTHIHSVMGGTSLSGKAARISKQQFADLKLSLDAYQQERYPELIHSLPEHGKALKEHTKAVILDKRTTGKAQVMEALENLKGSVSSLQQLTDTLQTLGYEPYYRNGILQGVQLSDGLKFRFTSLGIDLDEFDHSPQPEPADPLLTELCAIRNRAKEQETEREPKEDPIIEEEQPPINEENELNHLQCIRSLSRLTGVRGMSPQL